ncbi:MAG: serine hydrolase domain-containing protein [Pseudomonadota bacterium]
MPTPRHLLVLPLEKDAPAHPASATAAARWTSFVAATLTSILVAACGGGGGGPAIDVPRPPVSTSPPGQAANAAVDDFIQAELAAKNIPGLALAVIQNGKVVYSKGYGYADLARKIPVTTEQRFQIGSITKQFVATAVMILVDEGRIGLDQKIGSYLGSVPPQWQEMTVRHLLNHSSGLKENTYFPGLDSHGPYSSEQMLATLKGDPPIFAPGSSWAYSNPGYELLGILIEKVTGKFYGDFIEDRIFVPLGMTSARVIDSIDTNNSATGYVRKGSANEAQYLATLSTGRQSVIRFGAGGIEMSATDLAKWDAALLTEKILKQSSLALMWTGGPLAFDHGGAVQGDTYYGMGWFYNNFRGHRKHLVIHKSD